MNVDDTPKRRRRYTKQEKNKIVLETVVESVSEVAKRYDIAPRLLFSWRKKMGYGYRTDSTACRLEKVLLYAESLETAIVNSTTVSKDSSYYLGNTPFVAKSPLFPNLKGYGKDSREASANLIMVIRSQNCPPGMRESLGDPYQLKTAVNV